MLLILIWFCWPFGAGLVNGVIIANDTFYLEVYRIYLPLVNRQMTSYASFRTDPCTKTRQIEDGNGKDRFHISVFKRHEKTRDGEAARGQEGT